MVVFKVFYSCFLETQNKNNKKERRKTSMLKTRRTFYL